MELNERTARATRDERNAVRRGLTAVSEAARTGLVVVRHAPVDADGVCYGRSDRLTLVPAAEAARIVAERLPWRPAAVATSPSARCAEPARHLGTLLGVAVATDDRLQELDFGEWDGRSWRDVEARDGRGLRTWMSDWVNGRPPGGESATDLARRVGAWLQERPPIPILVITHAGVIRALRVILLGTPWPEALAADVPHLDPIGMA